MKTALKFSAFIFLILPAFGLGILGYNYLTGNIHPVISHQVYRSAQLDPKHLTQVIQKYHIKAIINLRGYQPEKIWYQAELKTTQQLNVKFYSFTFNAHHLTPRPKLLALVDLLQHAPRPLLIHCRHGADRSGLASAFSVILSNNNSLDYFTDQMSIWYSVLSPSSAGYQTTQNYLHWLKQHHLPHNQSNFLKWVNSDAPLKDYYGWFWT